jgi:RNA polymerase sigma factor (sigma-70 family)
MRGTAMYSRAMYWLSIYASPCFLATLPGMSDVTRILAQIDSGDPAAASQLLPLVYDELRRLARQKLTHEKPGQTLQATALVHEAYLRLVRPGVGSGESGVSEQRSEDRGQNLDEPNPPTPDSRSPTPGFDSRGHFFAAAAEAMRRILIDQARRKQADKRGGEWQRIELSLVEPAAPANDVDLLALNEALDRLASRDAQAAELVKLRFFAGLTAAQAASALGLPERTADRVWTYARSFLLKELGGQWG